MTWHVIIGIGPAAGIAVACPSADVAACRLRRYVVAVTSVVVHGRTVVTHIRHPVACHDGEPPRRRLSPLACRGLDRPVIRGLASRTVRITPRERIDEH